MNINKENDILETTLAIAEKGYSEAYHFLRNAYQENPQNYGPQTLYFLTCLAGGTKRPGEALEWLRKAIHDNKSRSKTSTVMHFVLFILLVFGLLGGGFTFLSTKLCTSLVAVGLDWLYFALMGLIAVLLGAFGSVFNTYAGLYLPKDNDLLLSMPIPVSALVAVRLSSVYLMGLLYSVVVIFPALIVYWATVGVTLPAVSDIWYCRLLDICFCPDGCWDFAGT